MNNLTKLIRTFILPEVYEVLKQIKPKFFEDEKYITNIKKWLDPIINLEDFYVYPINGITEGLNWWSGNEKRGIYKDVGDYEWVDNTGNNIKYITCPSSIDGNFISIPSDIPVILDIAFVGTTKIQKINIGNNVEKVFFSLSKSFGLQNIRTGWYFSRRPDIKLNKLHIKTQYYNYFAHQCAEEIIKNFSIDYVYNKLNAQQKSVCNNFNVTPSDSVWMGYSHDDNYTEFRRNNEIARLCLTNYFKNFYFGTKYN
tara:strand:+ start:314 stop:1078 length:765 start_codon:yes stop_codon:yes gene_type:complete